MKRIFAIFFAMMLIFSVVGCTSDRYKLTVKDREELLYERPAQSYQAGEQVVIKPHILYDVDLVCFVNGKSIGKQTAVETGDKYTHWEYYFEMPAEDVTVSFEVVGGF